MKNFLNKIVTQIKVTRREEFKQFNLNNFTATLNHENQIKAEVLYKKIREKFFLIAECKKASPAKGLLVKDYHPAQIATNYQLGGASAISVLTEPDFFQGSSEHLQAVRKAVDLPILWKDFVIHEEQIAHANHSGANLILLILRITETEKLYRFIDLSLEAGLLPLVEIFIDDDFERIIKLQERYQSKYLLGINNRNLATFKVDIKNTEKIITKIKDHNLNISLISESGINLPEEIAHIQKIGCAGALVGESLVKTAEPKQALKNLLHKLDN